MIEKPIRSSEQYFQDFQSPEIKNYHKAMAKVTYFHWSMVTIAKVTIDQ